MLRQSPPFLYVDRVYEIDSEKRSVRADLSLPAGRMAYGTDDGVPAYVLLESLAQTSGVLLRSLFAGEAGGVLIGTRKAELPGTLKLPVDLELRSVLTCAISPVFTFDAQVLCGGCRIACAEIQIYWKRNLDE